MLDHENCRVIHTGLFDDISLNALAGVLGQLSDGWGKDKPYYNKYWEAADVGVKADGEVVIYVWRDKYLPDDEINGFFHMGDAAVKYQFAYWIKKTAELECESFGYKGEWGPDGQFEHDCFRGSMTTAEAYRVYEALVK